MAGKTARAKITGNVDINVLLAFFFGVIFLSVMLAFAIFFPNPGPLQVRVFVTALALSAAGVGAVLPGTFHVQYKPLFRAGGALGLFAAVYWFQPALEEAAIKLVAPSAPPEPVVADYLNAVDAGNTREAWQQFDPVARQTIIPDFEQFRQIYETYRAPLGEKVARDLVGVNGVESPSGLPVGLYRVLSYRTKFANSPGCRAETVSVRATEDLNWRIFSHNISPTTIEC